MKKKKRFKKGKPLLTYAISKLRPKVFLHPVWVRFSHKDKVISPETIQDLFCEAEQLQRDHPSDACQVLLICAAYQNYSGQRSRALRTIQEALDLAERRGLAQETLWAMWGACAICVQQENYEQAAIHFDRLQAGLSKQNEWMLANYVDILKQSLSQFLTAETGTYSKAPRDPDQPSGDLLALTFRWLQQWGYSVQDSQSELGITCLHSGRQIATQSKLSQSFFSIQHWQDRWHTLLLVVRGGLRRQQAEEDPLHSKRGPSFWDSFLRLMAKSPASRTTHANYPDEALQTDNPSLLHPTEESLAHNGLSPSLRPDSRSEIDVANELSSDATISIPLVVHMLGTFSLTIGDLTIKLPASRGLSMLKYLLLHHKQGTPREVLMDIFWPDSSLEAARNKLNVAMHSLRRALRSATNLEVICFENGAYGFAPNLQISLDVEQFEHSVRDGQRLETQNQLTVAVIEYENAIQLYQADFLADTPYESWTILDRERLRIAYLDTLAHLSQIYFSQEQYASCITLCQLILTRDLCREDVHYRLMQCYSRLGQGPLALRQYQICAEALQAELEVDPAPETTRLYEQIHRHEQI